MLNITVEGKELKGIIEKALCNMDKKASLPILTTVLLHSENGKLAAITSKVSEYLEIRTEDYISRSDGKIAIAEEDLKVLMKMTGDVSLTETEENIIVKNGKKTISLMKYDVTQFPESPEGSFEAKVQMQESEFAETIANLSVFTSDCEANKIMQCLYFNLSESRIEALDGHRIGMKRIEDTQQVGLGNFMLHNTIVSDLKKALDKKSDINITISVGEKFNKVSGKNFTYYTKCVDGEYFRVKQMLTTETNTSCKTDKDGFLDKIKYYTDNVISKDYDRKPVVLKITDGKIITYGRNTRFEVSDEMEITDFYGKELSIGFNPRFLLEALKVADTKNVTMKFTNWKAPLFMDADKYSFCILPVNCKYEMDAMETYLSKVSAA